MSGCAKRICQWSGVVLVAAVCLLGWVPAAWCAEGDYDGTYAGTFSCNDAGFWVGIVDSGANSLYLFYSTASGTVDGGYVYWNAYAESGTVGNFTGWSEITYSYADAYIDSSDGSVNGDWVRPSSSVSGAFTGNKVISLSYTGSYSGTFSGDDTGTWAMTIASDGHATGSLSAHGLSLPFEGGCHPEGHVIVIGRVVSGDAVVVYGRISGNSVSGEWVSESGYGGTVSSGSSDSSDGGGGGGGGCFIMSLAGQQAIFKH